MQPEPQRLAGNQRNLLESLDEPVLLVNDVGRIEYMNPGAERFFAQTFLQTRHTFFEKQLEEIIVSLRGGGSTQGGELIVLENTQYSCKVAPFVGYKGDCLYWVIISWVANSGDEVQTAALPLNYGSIIGSSETIVQLRHLTSQVGQTDANVLITGESGTGKELVARLIHQISTRRDRPFFAINCTTFNDELLANELFGHEKGAFTGANSLAKGKFEAADGGILFLDEIGDISPRVQAALLRVLQSGEIVRVGGNQPLLVNVRILAATSCNLRQAVQENRFRLDLFYRLNILSLAVPPLRQRGDDILELAEHFFSLYGKLFGREVRFDRQLVKAKLLAYDWPGNIRELQNVIQRAVLMNKTGRISNDDLLLTASATKESGGSLSALISSGNASSLKGIVEQVEREIILQKLAKHGGNVADTALALDISKAALYDKMRRHNISAKALR